MAKDNRWLQVEVCREFLRQSCSRPEDECRFAHPPPNVEVVNGRVVACFDNIKGRCHRDTCRYLHPPRHIREQLENAGKSHSAAVANGTNGHSYQSMPGDPFLTQNSPTWSSGTIPPFASSPGVGPPSSLAGVAAAAAAVAAANQSGGRRADKSDRLEACREFLRGTCNRSENECRFAHPPEHINVDSSDSTVTVCMDFMKDRCSRETCRYFHPPPHLKQRVRQQQQQHQATMNASSPTGLSSNTLGMEQLCLGAQPEDVDQPPPPPPPQFVPVYDASQVPMHSVPIPVPGAVALEHGLASAVNTSVLAMQQQPSVVKYQEMMANYASGPQEAGVMSYTWGSVRRPPRNLPGLSAKQM